MTHPSRGYDIALLSTPCHNCDTHGRRHVDGTKCLYGPGIFLPKVWAFDRNVPNPSLVWSCAECSARHAFEREGETACRVCHHTNYVVPPDPLVRRGL